MRQLVLALCAEGATDYRFLPIVVQRTAHQILCRHKDAVAPVEVLEPTPVEPAREAEGAAESILSAARRARGYHALVVHMDAGARTRKNALQNSYVPGEQLVRTCEDGEVCEQLLPVIPIHMTEAWMMADSEAFARVVGSDLSGLDIGFPPRPHQVEAIEDPKHTLQLALGQAFSGRRRRKKARLGEYYEPLGRQVSLETLEKVPAFRQFVRDLTRVLTDLHFLVTSES